MRTTVVLALTLAGTLGATMALGANVYQAVVEVPNWSASVPATVQDFRACVAHSNPGYFFQVLVPITILSLLAAIVASWRPARRQAAFTLVALAGIASAEVFTVVYFFPRNEVLFFGDLAAHAPSVIEAAAREWAGAHWLRMAMLTCGVAAAFRALLLASAPRTPLPAAPTAAPVE